jgi:hypothetical protein
MAKSAPAAFRSMIYSGNPVGINGWAQITNPRQHELGVIGRAQMANPHQRHSRAKKHRQLTTSLPVFFNNLLFRMILK